MEVSMNLKHIWQRIIKGHDDSMYWSLDMTLTVLIREMLEEYLKVADKFTDLDNKNFTGSSRSKREYLEEVIQAFRDYEDITYNEVEYLERYESNYKKYEEEITRRRERLKTLFDKDYDSLWW